MRLAIQYIIRCATCKGRIGISPYWFYRRYLCDECAPDASNAA